MIRVNKPKLQEFKDLHGMNDSDLANALNFTAGYISRVLSGKDQPSGLFIAKLHVLTGLKMDDLFFCPERPVFRRSQNEYPKTKEGVSFETDATNPIKKGIPDDNAK